MVVAVTSHAVFESGGAEDPDGLYAGGIAFPLLQVGIQPPHSFMFFFSIIGIRIYYRNRCKLITVHSLRTKSIYLISCILSVSTFLVQKLQR